MLASAHATLPNLPNASNGRWLCWSADQDPSAPPVADREPTISISEPQSVRPDYDPLLWQFARVAGAAASRTPAACYHAEWQIARLIILRASRNKPDHHQDHADDPSLDPVALQRHHELCVFTYVRRPHPRDDLPRRNDRSAFAGDKQLSPPHRWVIACAAAARGASRASRPPAPDRCAGTIWSARLSCLQSARLDPDSGWHEGGATGARPRQARDDDGYLCGCR